MPALTKEELNALLPHAGAMRLIDRVESWDATTIRCHTQSHRDQGNPLRHNARLEAVAGLEYAAQAMGIHVGLLHRTRSMDGLIGYVGGLRDVVLGVDRLDGYKDVDSRCPRSLQEARQAQFFQLFMESSSDGDDY